MPEPDANGTIELLPGEKDGSPNSSRRGSSSPTNGLRR